MLCAVEEEGAPFNLPEFHDQFYLVLTHAVSIITQFKLPRVESFSNSNLTAGMAHL